MSNESLSVVQHYIGGSTVTSASGRTSLVYDPALGVATRKVALADQVEVDAAVASASAAFPQWRDLSITKR